MKKTQLRCCGAAIRSNYEDAVLILDKLTKLTESFGQILLQDEILLMGFRSILGHGSDFFVIKQEISNVFYDNVRHVCAIITKW